MPDETPESAHPLDAGLRSQATRRRAELGPVEPAMPGPMRTHLQAEVDRLQARDDRSRVDRPGFLAWFFQWQRALATVGVTLLVLGFFAWNDGWFVRRPALAAKQAPAVETSASPANTAAPSPADALAKRSDAPSADLDVKEQSKPAITQPPPGEGVAAGKLEAPPKLAQPQAPTVAAAPAPVAPVAEPRSEAFASKSTAAGLRQSFVQAPAQGAERARRSNESKDERAVPLLNAFEFRQDGNRIEIVDADGSVYSGEIEARLKKDKGLAVAGRDQASAAAPVGEAKKPATKSKNEEVAAQFNFRASGMNNTLRQQVTIEGVYQAPAVAETQPSAPGAAASGGTTAQDALKAGRPQPSQRQMQSRARVTGRAQVDGRNVPVDAEATK